MFHGRNEQIRKLHITATQLSKSSKRRKDTRLKQFPNLREASKQGKTPVTKTALNFFDNHYKQVFGPEWHAIRLALLSKPKFAALLNNFSDKDTVSEKLKSQGCQSIQEIYNSELSDIVSSDPTLAENQDISQQLPKRPVKVEVDEFEELKVVEKSMSVEDAKSRIIDPDEVIIGGGKSSMSMYEFVPSEKIISEEEFLEESEYFKSHNPNMPFVKIHENFIEFPKKLDAYIFPEGDFDHFQAPKRLNSGPFNYYCLDLASIIPVLMLDLKSGDHLLDLCSGPGGKSLVAMQTLKPAKIVCNDVEHSRVQRIKHVMQSFLLDKYNQRLGIDVLNFSKRDGVKCYEYFEEQFDKVLCDVPCFTDRHTIFNEEGNLFQTHRSKERLKMPELQAQLLQSAILCTKPGGTIVYSTCTLSPIQNDGVVSLALKQIWEETKIDMAICDLSKAILPLKPMLKYAQNTRFGQLVIPQIAQNYGPMYFAKLKRIN